jgi:hypothetical protein
MFIAAAPAIVTRSHLWCARNYLWCARNYLWCALLKTETRSFSSITFFVLLFSKIRRLNVDTVFDFIFSLFPISTLPMPIST